MDKFPFEKSEASSHCHWFHLWTVSEVFRLPNGSCCRAGAKVLLYGNPVKLFKRNSWDSRARSPWAGDFWKEGENSCIFPLHFILTL